MKTIKFLLHKIIIVEVILIILYFACSFFGVHISIVDTILTTGLKYLTPIALIAVIPYIILSLLSTKLVETIIGFALGALILYYLYTYLI